MKPNFKIGFFILISFFITSEIIVGFNNLLFNSTYSYLIPFKIALSGLIAFCVTFILARIIGFMGFLVFLKKIQLPIYFVSIIYLTSRIIQITTRRLEKSICSFRIRTCHLNKYQYLRAILWQSRGYIILVFKKILTLINIFETKELNVNLPFEIWKSNEHNS